MKKSISLLFALTIGLSLVACQSQNVEDNSEEKTKVLQSVINGGFESSDLSG